VNAMDKYDDPWLESLSLGGDNARTGDGKD
jgi:hypothetical protein